MQYLGGGLLSHGACRTTIGAEGLNCCVRDGNRCTPFARTTKRLHSYEHILLARNYVTREQNYVLKRTEKGKMFNRPFVPLD